MQNISSYGQFLAFLLSVGPALQKLWPKIQAFIAAYSDLATAIRDVLGAQTPAGQAPAPEGTLQLVASPDMKVDGTLLSAGMLEQEAKVAALIAGPSALFDGAILRSLWKFAKEHPELISVIVSLLGKGS